MHEINKFPKVVFLRLFSKVAKNFGHKKFGHFKFRQSPLSEILIVRIYL